MLKIRICTGRRCCENFSLDTLKAAQDFLEKKTVENDSAQEMMVETTTCMSFCEQGPNILMDDKIFHQMSAFNLKEKLQKLFPQKDLSPQSKKRNAEFGLESISDLLK